MTCAHLEKKREQARADLIAAGITITEWAEKNGFSRGAVYAVLSGRVQGRFGEGHEIAVALGIKHSIKES